MIFVAKYVSMMVFGGGILGSAHKIWGNPYLNSTIVLFDMSPAQAHGFYNAYSRTRFAK